MFLDLIPGLILLGGGKTGQHLVQGTEGFLLECQTFLRRCQTYRRIDGLGIDLSKRFAVDDSG